MSPAELDQLVELLNRYDWEEVENRHVSKRIRQILDGIIDTWHAALKEENRAARQELDT